MPIVYFFARLSVFQCMIQQEQNKNRRPEKGCYPWLDIYVDRGPAGFQRSHNVVVDAGQGITVRPWLYAGSCCSGSGPEAYSEEGNTI